MKALQNSVWRAHVVKYPQIAVDAIFACIYHNFCGSALFSELIKIAINSSINLESAVIFSSQLNRVIALKNLSTVVNIQPQTAFELCSMAYMKDQFEQVKILERKVDSKKWSFFLKFIETEEESILDEYQNHFIGETEDKPRASYSSDSARVSKQSDVEEDSLSDLSEKELISYFFDPLLYYSIQKRNMDIVDSLFSISYHYNPPLKFIFFAMLNAPNICHAMIEQGLIFDGDIIRRQNKMGTLKKLLVLLCEYNLEIISYVFLENAGKNFEINHSNKEWKKDFITKRVMMLEFILKAMISIDPNCEIPEDALWNAMASGDEFAVDLLLKYGAKTAWMESPAKKTLIGKILSKPVLDSSLALKSGNEIISSYAGGHHYQYDQVPSILTSVYDADESSEAWDLTSEAETETPSSIEKGKVQVPTPTAQCSAWDMVLSSTSESHANINVLLAANSMLPWMEPTRVMEDKMDHLEVKIEEQNKMLRALSGMY